MNWYRRAQSSLAPFLENPELAWEWAKDNIDIDCVEEDVEENPDDGFLASQLEDYLEKAGDYSEMYLSVKRMKAVILYRMIRVPSIKELKWDGVGTHWSFKPEGAGVYGDVPYGMKKSAIDVLLTGSVPTSYIDWEYSFTSYMYYGASQWECSIDVDAPVTVTHINGKSIIPRQAMA